MLFDAFSQKPSSFPDAITARDTVKMGSEAGHANINAIMFISWHANYHCRYPFP